ncbi:MAG: ATP-binding protein [Candidatus Limnocylindria bacterium]
MQRHHPRASASDRARSELRRARDLRLGRPGSVLAGIAFGLAAIAGKGVVLTVAGGDSGYILLLAACVGAAWVGGVLGGLAATVVGFALNAVLFLDTDATFLADDSLERFRQALFLIVALGTAVLVGSRRASRDRLEDALTEASVLAEAIEARDDRLELILAASGTGFWEWDIRNDDLQWSEAIFRQHGLDPDGPAPDFPTYLQTVHPEDREAFQAAIADAMSGARSFDIEFRILWPDGSVHWTRGSGRVFRDEAGNPVRMLGTGQDITERRRLEIERDQLLVEERQAGEFREAFIDVISHELRTPVTTILGAAQILANRERVLDDGVHATLIDDVHLESERLHRLVEDLLVLARTERGRLVVDAEPLNVARLLERVVEAIGRELSNIAVALDVEPGLPIVSGEATYVEQVLRNLLGNAAKYSPQGTAVLVTATSASGAVEIRVLDAGPGIPEGSETRLFELFYRSPEQARLVAGSGIGLFVCAKLVEAMGGRIWAARRPGGGAEFGFTLRVLEGDADADDHAGTAAVGATREGGPA